MIRLLITVVLLTATAHAWQPAPDSMLTDWINDTKADENTGGNLPFFFDITDALKNGPNTLTLKATDSTNQPDAYQLHGKHVLKPGGIWYTPLSGIWQTVWMEEVPEKHIVSAKITPSVRGKVSISLNTTGGSGEATVTTSLDGKEVAKRCRGRDQRLDHLRPQGAKVERRRTLRDPEGLGTDGLISRRPATYRHQRLRGDLAESNNLYLKHPEISTHFETAMHTRNPELSQKHLPLNA